MPGFHFHFDIFHLAVYLVVALAWFCLCLLLAFHSKRLARQRLYLGGWGVPLSGVLLIGGLLLLDVLVFLDRDGLLLLALMLVGVGVAALGIWRILRLRD